MNANRRFLYEMLGSGLELDTILPDDIIKHITPEVLAHHLPVAMKAKLLEASLSAQKMSPSLIIEVIGIEGLAEHAPIGVLWACLSECAKRSLQEDDPSALNVIDDAKPVKARPVPSNSMRPPVRVSTLSPRSRVTGQNAARPAAAAQAKPANDSQPEGSLFDVDTRIRDPRAPEEAEYGQARGTRDFGPGEDETRPGDVVAVPRK